MSDNPIFHVTGTVVFSSIIEPILSGSMMSDDRIARNQWVIREFNHDVDAALDGTTANVIFRGWMMRTPEHKMFTISPVYVHFFNRPKNEFDSRAYCTTYPESVAK